MNRYLTPGRTPIVKKSTFEKDIDFSPKKSIIIIVRGTAEDHRDTSVSKGYGANRKKNKFPLDKPHGMWYNEYSQEGEPRVERHRQGSKKNKKKSPKPS